MINYADDNSPFSRKDNIESVIIQLTIDSKSLLEWIPKNGLRQTLINLILLPIILRGTFCTGSTI